MLLLFVFEYKLSTLGVRCLDGLMKIQYLNYKFSNCIIKDYNESRETKTSLKKFKENYLSIELELDLELYKKIIDKVMLAE